MVSRAKPAAKSSAQRPAKSAVPRAAASVHRSSALALAWVFATLIVYASLYPFSGWAWPAGLGWREVLHLPLPPWRIPFDMVANLLGYWPLGLLIYIAGVRRHRPAWRSALWAVVLPVGLSLVLELTQHFLPGRFPSLLDWGLNSLGAVLGMALGAVLHRWRFLGRWQSWRERWFIEHSAGALALLCLWPFALLFPAPMPFGLGLGWARVQDLLIDALLDVPWAQTMLEWVSDLPVAEGRLPAVGEGLAVTLGLLGPCLLANAVTRSPWRRGAMAVALAAVGGLATTFSAAMNFGPGHALGWVTPELLPAAVVAAVLALVCAWLPQRLCAALGMVALAVLAVLVAQAPADPFFAISLQAWEQGRFIRFHGLAQWLGWLWPYAAVVWLGWRVAMPDAVAAAASGPPSRGPGA